MANVLTVTSTTSTPRPTLWQSVRGELRPLIGLAVPLIAGLASSTAISLTDTYFIGALGELPLAAASLTSSVILILYASLYGFLYPISILVGQAFGAGEVHKIASVLRHGLVLGLGIGVLGAVLMGVGLLLLPHAGQPPEVVAIIAPYWVMMALLLIPYCVSLVYKQVFDAIEKPWTGVGLTLIAVIINVPLTWILTSGQFGVPALGLFGAGLASFAATLIGLLITALYFQFAPALAPYRLRSDWRRSEFAEQVREGTPMAFQYLLEGGAVTVAGILIGWLGATALAANQIVFSVASVLYMIPLGMAGAVSIRIAQSVGGDERGRLRGIGAAGVGLVVLWTAVMTIALATMGERIARIFVAEADVIGIAGLMFLVVGLMQVFDGVQSVSLGALRGMLDSRWPTLVSLIAYWLIALPLSWALGFPLGLGAPGVWGGFGFGLLIAAFLLWRRFHRNTEVMHG
ncbi:MAG: MATE family efflux transporter [Chloroflexota bacterium]|nr:MATE family efflux transporter [Chloroflexota bacterium]